MGGREQDVAADEQVGHAGHASRQGGDRVPAWNDRRGSRDRNLVRLHLTVLPHRGAPRGVDGAPVRRSAHVVALRSAPRVSAARASRAPTSWRAMERATTPARATCSPRRISCTRRLPRWCPNTRMALELGERRAPRGCTAPTTTASWTPTGPRASISRSAPRSSSSRATPGSPMRDRAGARRARLGPAVDDSTAPRAGRRRDRRAGVRDRLAAARDRRAAARVARRGHRSGARTRRRRLRAPPAVSWSAFMQRRPLLTSSASSGRCGAGRRPSA